MKNYHLLLPALLGLTLGTLPAQSLSPVPEPAKPQSEMRIELDPVAPLDSLEKQLMNASYEQRGDLATAFDTASRSIPQRVAELQAQGLQLNDAASGNLEEARRNGAQFFRDLSLSTPETWRTSRHNALMALRKIRSSLEVLRQTGSADRI